MLGAVSVWFTQSQLFEKDKTHYMDLLADADAEDEMEPWRRDELLL